MDDAQKQKEANPHKHAFEIIVNGRQKEVTEKELSFGEILALAFTPVPSGPNWCFTVTYRKGADKPEGSLMEGDAVKIKQGMIFNVTATDKS